MIRVTRCGFLALLSLTLVAADDPAPRLDSFPNFPLPAQLLESAPSDATPSPESSSPGTATRLSASVQTMLLFGLASLAPAAILMVSAFVRISIVLGLVRQALGNPQVPGNQVMTVLALLLTALVMQPVGTRVYRDAVEPYLSGKETNHERLWKAGSEPIKAFMIEQIVRTHHDHYLWELRSRLPAETSGEPEPTECEQFPLAIIATAFVLSELTTALFIGFAIFLPFLVIDLVVSSVLSAMGLFMLPPTLVAIPLKLVLFVLADGWMLVAGMLLRSFG